MKLLQQLWNLEAKVGDVVVIGILYVVFVARPWQAQVGVFAKGGFKALLAYWFNF